MRPDTPQRYSHITVKNVNGRVKYAIFVKPWTQFFDLKGRKDIPKSYASDVRIKNCKLDYSELRHIEEAPDQFELKRIVFRKIRRTSKP